MRIIDILRTDVARAVEDRKKSSLGPFPNSITVPNETIAEPMFHIKDCKAGNGTRCVEGDPERAATYFNDSETGPYNLLFIRYEDYLKQFCLSTRQDWSKGLGRADYIVVTPDVHDHFILHEVSIGKISSKQGNAMSQFTRTMQLLLKVSPMKDYIASFAVRRCFVSARGCDDLPRSPRGVAAGFARPYSHIPNPVEIKADWLNRQGFSVWKGNRIPMAHPEPHG